MSTEEFVTITIIEKLKKNGWNILCYDFPQSGTGFSLKQNNSSSKNLNIVIPDVVAEKNGVGVLFENKDRFFLADFNKIEKLRTTDEYSNSLKLLIGGDIPVIMGYGIAFPHVKGQIEKAKLHFRKIDFLVTVSPQRELVDYYNPKNIAF